MDPSDATSTHGVSIPSRRRADLLVQVPLFERLGPGEFFGETSLLHGGPRTATVLAETPVLAIRIFEGSFDEVVAQEPTVAPKILAAVVRRLREAERRLND